MFNNYVTSFGCVICTGLYKGELNQHRGTIHVRAQLFISIAH